MKQKNQTMLQGPLLSSIIFYTVPIILTSILQLLFNAADLVIVGQFCGSLSVAAVGATGSLTSLIVTLFVGISVGAGVAVAHSLGSREETAVHRTVHTALPTALVCGVALTFIGIFISEPLLRLMGTPENVLPLSAVYMKIYFGGITFSMVYNFCAAILRAAGDTKSPLIFLTIAGVINVLLNVVFVTVLHMNVAGVALATTISQGVSAILVVIALMRRTDACRLKLSEMRFYKAQFFKILRVGLPAGIQSSLFAISNVLIQSSINSFGDIFVAGNAAAGNIEGFVYVTVVGFSQTAMNYIGQNAGARQYTRIKKILGICLACTTVIGITAGSLVYMFAPKLLSIYITDSQQAISYGIIRLTYICLPYFVCGLMDTYTSALRGMGAAITPMIISVLGVCGVRLCWIYTVFQIPQFHTPECLYLSYIISWTITMLCQMLAFSRVYRRNSAVSSAETA